MAPANPTPAPPAAELNEMHNARGLTYRQMASFYGVGLATIRRWMDEQSVPRMRSGNRPAELASVERKRPSKAELERLYAEGLTQKEIAEKLGFSNSTINTMFREHGIATRPGTRNTVDITSHEYEFVGADIAEPPPAKRRTKPDRETMIRLYHDEELDLAQIGERYGYSARGMAKIMDRYGIERRPKGWLPPTEPTRETLTRLTHEEGLTDAAIAERYGITKAAVWARRKRYGIASRDAADNAAPATHTPDPAPTPPPRTGKAKQGQPPKRPWLRLSETERKIVARRVDEFLIYAQLRREPGCYTNAT